MKTLGYLTLALLALLSAAFMLAESQGLTEQDFYTALFATDRLDSRMIGAAIGALLTLDLFLPVPSSVLMTLSGVYTGPWVGALINFTGAMGSALIGFGLCRRYGQTAFQKLIGREQQHDVERFFDRFGIWVILLSRSVPMLTEIISCLAGLSTMSWRRFSVLSALGTAPISILYAWAGWRFGMEHALGWAILIALVLPAALYLLIYRGKLRSAIGDTAPREEGTP